MKRIIYFLAFTAFISSSISAQEDEGGFVWGARLGLNYSSFAGENSDDYDVKTGAVLSLFTRLDLNNSFYFQPEINYTSKGMSDRVEINNVKFEFVHAYTYLEVPILVKYDFGSVVGDGFKPELFIGPFAAMKLNSEITLEENQSGDPIEINDIKSFDYGVAFGGGFGVAVDNVDVLFELRWTLSMNKFDNSSQNLDFKHKVFSLSLGFFIN